MVAREEREILKFPHDPLLVKLLLAVQQTSCTIHDAHGFDKNYPEMLSDILYMRELLRVWSSPSAIDERGLLREENQYIATLVTSGYEFLVAFFSIRAMGGVCVPLASGIFPEEAQYLLLKAKTTCLLAGKDSMERAHDIYTYINDHKHGQSGTFRVLPISCDPGPFRNLDIRIDDTIQMDPGGPGIVLFSSGTTGLPKGVVLPKRCFSTTQPTEPGEIALSYRPSHWIGGAGTLIRHVLSGRELYITEETRSGRPCAEVVLEAFRSLRITHAAFTPDLLRTMKDLLVGESSVLVDEPKEKLASYFRGLSAIKCSSGMLESSTREFWTDLTGLPFENIYAMTELGGAVMRGVSGVQGSIGTPFNGVEVKLSEGSHGELYVKKSTMFSHYIGDENITKDAFDEEGYYKTGDLASLKDGDYIFAGRANADYVRFGIFQIATLVVENSLMDLPYVSEACVVGVPDNDSGQLCGAIIRLQRDSTPTGQITLAQIRSDLEGNLASCMLPTVLRVLADEEELPLTVSGKPRKKEVLKVYLGSTDGVPAKIDPPGVERWDARLGKATKPWDLGGLQIAE